VNNLAIIETILRNRRRFFGEIREGVGLDAKIRAMLFSGIAFFGLYGMVMGSRHSLWQVLSSAVKLPLLFLATLVVCLPTLYFFNLIFGSNQSLTQNFALILTAITVTAVLLLSFSPIVLFFLLTTANYQFFKLLNVGVFTIAGMVGVRFLGQGMQIVSAGGHEGAGPGATWCDCGRWSTPSWGARWPGRCGPSSALRGSRSSCSGSWAGISTPMCLPVLASCWAS
jgi:hypothetical protein